jgi:Uma2 family endonuclease
VLSPSTRYFDQSEKFRLYRTIASLQNYVMVSQDRMSIELYSRQSGKHWLFEEIAGFGWRS